METKNNLRQEIIKLAQKKGFDLGRSLERNRDVTGYVMQYSGVIFTFMVFSRLVSLENLGLYWLIDILIGGVLVVVGLGLVYVAYNHYFRTGKNHYGFILSGLIITALNSAEKKIFAFSDKNKPQNVLALFLMSIFFLFVGSLMLFGLVGELVFDFDSGNPENPAIYFVVPLIIFLLLGISFIFLLRLFVYKIPRAVLLFMRTEKVARIVGFLIILLMAVLLSVGFVADLIFVLNK